MENKEYYTPDISDLFVGYELQLMNIENGHWGKYVIKDNDSLSNFKKEIESNSLRTKYLDKEDIESFGFKYDEKKEEFISNKTYLGIGIGDDKKIHIFYDEYRRLTIYYKENRGEEHVVFDGKCLSINELRKIISYLNIETNGK